MNRRSQSLLWQSMQVVASLLILITLTCPVMCRWGGSCCIHESSVGGAIQTCCQHCLHESQGSSFPEEIPSRPDENGCSCLCAGAVLTESMGVADLSDQSALFECWVSATSVENHFHMASRFSRVAVPPAAFGAALRLLECSLRC